MIKHFNPCVIKNQNVFDKKLSEWYMDKDTETQDKPLWFTQMTTLPYAGIESYYLASSYLISTNDKYIYILVCGEMFF